MSKGEHLEVRYVPSVIDVPCIHESQKKGLGMTVLLPLFFLSHS